MTQTNGHQIPRPVWTYGYALVPPVPRNRMGSVAVLLKTANREASQASRTWKGQLINGADVTHILVVSDTADQHMGINDRLEAELARLKAPYLVTESVRIGGPEDFPDSYP